MNLQPEQLRRLMRRHSVTIRELSHRMGIPMSRIRHYRERGVSMPVRLDFEQAIAGEFTPRMRAMLNQWRLN